MHLTRSVQFSASHRYFRPEWSEERNREVFGPCTNAPGHGHNYECTVTVTGPFSEDTAMVRFEGEWHGTSRKPSNFLRTQMFLRKWFERWGTHDDGRAVTTTTQGGGS